VKSLEEIEDEEWGLFFEDEYFDEEE